MAAYFLTPTNRGKNLTALGSSMIFYSWGQPRFVLVLLTSIAFNTVAALFIDRCEGRARTTALGACPSNRRILLAREGRVRFCLWHEQDIPRLEDR